MEAECEVAAGSCSLHVADVVRDKEGPIGSVLNAEHEETSQGAYGPWVVVTRKKTRNIKSSGTSSPQESVPSRQVQGINGFVVRTVEGLIGKYSTRLKECAKPPSPARVKRWPIIFWA